MVKQVRNVASCFVALSLSLVACGDGDDEGNFPTGGSGGKGGSSGSSGSPGKGGTAGSGTGGSAGKGGTAGSGTGGTAGQGGSAGSTAGSGTGGSAGDGESGSAGEVNSAGNAGEGSGGTAGDGASGTAGEGSGGTAGDGVGGGAGGEPAAAGAGGDGTAGAGEGGAPVAGGAGGEGGAPVVVADVLDNGGFEVHHENWVDVPPWVRSADVEAHMAAASYKEDGGARTGMGYLNVWIGTAYEVTVSQVVEPLPNGTYSVTLWHEGGAYLDQYVFVRGHDEANALNEIAVDTVPGDDYAPLTIPNIPVTSGRIEIGIYSDAQAGAWSHFDDVALTLVTP